MLTGSPYTQMNFDQWQQLNTGSAYAAAFSVYGPHQYDFTRTPTTSGSDESMNDSRIDPKLSPKYKEKRKKNNEAAKKSRAQRKQREAETTNENIKLKERNAKLEDECKHMANSIHELTKQLEVYKRRIEVYEETKFSTVMMHQGPQQENKYPLGEMNAQPSTTSYNGRTYESLN